MKAWEDFLKLQEIELGPDIVKKWLRPLQIKRFDAGNLYLQADNPFQLDWFEQHIRKKIASLKNNNNRKVVVHLSLAQEMREKKSRSKIIPESTFQISFDVLDPYATFETYISTASPLPYKLLKELDEVVFNPIYLYGIAGTGKTHLLTATTHALRLAGKHVIYASAPTFTEHVVSAIKAGEMRLFRQSYRKADVLIIDDVHLFDKKLATQEELFHTFNTLHLSGKQIILSANCPASHLEIEPRLISRFEWGLALPLAPINTTDREKMLHIKAEYLNFPLNTQTTEFLLKTFRSIHSLCRALEALVLRMHLHHKNLSSTQLTETSIEKMLSDLIHKENENALTAEKIMHSVAAYFGICVDDILGKAQSREYVLPRQLAMYLCRTQLNLPFKKIGDVFEKDHSTVMASVKMIQNGIDTNNIEIYSAFHTLMKKM